VSPASVVQKLAIFDLGRGCVGIWPSVHTISPPSAWPWSPRSDLVKSLSNLLVTFLKPLTRFELKNLWFAAACNSISSRTVNSDFSTLQKTSSYLGALLSELVTTADCAYSATAVSTLAIRLLLNLYRAYRKPILFRFNYPLHLPPSSWGDSHALVPLYFLAAIKATCLSLGLVLQSSSLNPTFLLESTHRGI